MTTTRLTAAASVALALVLSGGAARADLTPEQVWQDWQSYLEGFGYAVTGETSESGDTLVIEDLGLSMQMPENEGSVSMRLGRVELSGRDDGSVSVLLPESMPVAIAALDDEQQEVTMTLRIGHRGLDMVVSGTPEAMTYTYAAEEMTMALTDLAAGGTPVGIGVAEIRLGDMAGTSLSAREGDLRKLDQTMTAGPVAYEVDITDPETGGRFAMTGNVATARFAGEGTIPQSFDANNLAASLGAGFRFDSRFEYETGSSAYRFEEGDQVAEGTQGSDSGRLTTAIGADGLRYGGEGRNVSMAMTSSDLPFPVNLEMVRMAFDLVMPVSKSEAAQDFAVTLDLSEFTMSDMVWALFDPGNQLPRDPATLAIDLSGKGRLFFDLLDPATAAKLDAEDAAPGEIEALDLNGLTLSLAGAKLSGSGAFTFDQEDRSSFEGMAAPEGAIDLELVGGNTLLDKLISMGLVPQDQATGVRMMLGLFAQPGEGTDTLTSRIEFTEDGQVLANGQRLK